MPFLLSHFSPGDKIENCSAQFLAVCCLVVALSARRLPFAPAGEYHDEYLYS
jgi:hypothetical protein